ncbi:hypothetical protein [Bacillus sp. V59.32b]|uniref:hypothetical protein n=1 Tax=Bacillus sp. V59.32b TaxID=1758642 RepID=UPI0013593261|nr:hypothetical protein [Bacillus sp. V59.32b]
MLELVKEIYSPSKAYKVEINKRLRDGLLKLTFIFGIVTGKLGYKSLLPFHLLTT